jgi:hypothetical protein
MEAPEAHCPGAPNDTSLTHSRSDYPLNGCVAALPGSASSDEQNHNEKQISEHPSNACENPGGSGLAPDTVGITN